MNVAISRVMEEHLLAYRNGRRRRGDGSPTQPEPIDIDLRAYEVASRIDGDKYTFSKIIPELMEHKAAISPLLRRFLVRRLRRVTAQLHERARRLEAIADQFEEDDVQSQSQPVEDAPPLLTMQK